MKELLVVPQIDQFDTFKEFANAFSLSEKDLILTNEYIYNPVMAEAGISCPVIFQEKYGQGEPTDVMVDAILKEMTRYECSRIVAVGGGTILDIAKVMCLEDAKDTDSLYDRGLRLMRDNRLRRHHLLVAYQDLSPAEQAKDDYAWELLGQLSETAQGGTTDEEV